MQGSGFTFKNPNATGRLRLRQLVLGVDAVTL
jgi:hypothetical protein